MSELINLFHLPFFSLFLFYLILSAILIITFCIVAVLGRNALSQGEWWAILMLAGSALLCSMVTIIIWRQPESKTKLSFKVSHRAMQACGEGPVSQPTPANVDRAHLSWTLVLRWYVASHSLRLSLSPPKWITYHSQAWE